MPRQARRPWVMYLAGSVSLLVAIAALFLAVRWYGRPYPSVLVDPDLVISSMGLPTWDSSQKGLRFPDRIVTVDGQDLRQARSKRKVAVLDDAVRSGYAAGHQSIQVTVESDRGTQHLQLALVPFEGIAWWIFGGGLIIIGVLYTAAGMVAATASPRGRLARTFAKHAMLASLFLCTVFDFHTTRQLVPLFLLSFPWAPISAAMLALRLPDDVPLLIRLPWLEHVADAVSLAVAAALLLSHYGLGYSLPMRMVATAILGTGGLFLSVTFVTRFVLAKGSRRAVMRALLIPMVPTIAFVGLAGLLGSLSAAGPSLALCTTPALAVVPLSSLAAFVRHDLWGSRALVSRLASRVLVTAVCFLVAASAGGVFAGALGVPFARGLAVSALAGLIAAITVPLTLALSDRRLFPSHTGYKPTVEQLSWELTSAKTREAVFSAVESTVLRWLPCERVELFDRASQAPPDPARGSSAPPPDDGDAPLGRVLRELVTYGETHLGTLTVFRAPGDPLFTSEDADLLRTIANQAALALSHADTYAELERRRREQAAAWRGEREALVETVAAEIAHEVRYSINFFRSILQQGAAGGSLDAEDVDIGTEEVDRLERLVAGLRKVTRRSLERKVTRLSELVARAEMLLRDRLGAGSLIVEVDPQDTIRCDPDQATQVLVNLISNAVDAGSEQCQIGVRWVLQESGAQLVVWDTGPGFEGSPAQLFAPWFTTKPRGTGLGLAIAHRIVRAHDWTIDAQRVDGQTRFIVCVPEADIVRLPARPSEGETA